MKNLSRKIRNVVRSVAGTRRSALTTAAVLVSILIALESIFDFDFSLGIFYVLPVMFAASVLTRNQIVLAAMFCAYTRGLFTPQETFLEHWLRFAMATIAYTGCGLFIYQIAEARRNVLVHYSRLRVEQQLRRRAQEQLRLLAESSPAAILTLQFDGVILAANRAAQKILQVEHLEGRPVGEFMPVFAHALELPATVGEIRTAAVGMARRADGSAFPVSTWFSIYGEGRSRRLAAIVVDKSVEFREREYAKFEQMVAHDRILTGAVSHEIRNLSSAILVVASNMERNGSAKLDADFAALKNLLSGLKGLASLDARKHTRMERAPLSLKEFGDEMRVIIGQDWEDMDGTFEWDVPEDFPQVLVDRHGLVQVMLNLSQNAQRAVEEMPKRQMRVTGEMVDGMVRLVVCDSGPGMQSTENLFQPFRPGAQGSGLGLYVSRVLMESFDGALEYVPTEKGCCFSLLLPTLMQPQRADEAGAVV